MRTAIVAHSRASVLVVEVLLVECRNAANEVPFQTVVVE